MPPRADWRGTGQSSTKGIRTVAADLTKVPQPFFIGRPRNLLIRKGMIDMGYGQWHNVVWVSFRSVYGFFGERPEVLSLAGPPRREGHGGRNS